MKKNTSGEVKYGDYYFCVEAAAKDYKRDCNRTCWHSTKNCEKCGALMITQGDEDDYWCEYCE